MAAYERWDGKGWPAGTKGAAIPIASRLAQLAEFVEVAHRVGGVETARALARERAAKQFDPELARLLDAEAETLFADLDAIATWEAVIGAEPALAVVIAAERFDATLLAIANFVDLKSPYFLGHARGGGRACGGGRERLGMAAGEVRTLRRAALVHDLGRLGVSNSIWDKRGPLGAGEWERVRLHPYLTSGCLRQSEALAPLGAIAVQHRERLDGSGYPRGLEGHSDLATGTHPRCRRRLSGDARAAAAPARAAAPTRRLRSYAPRSTRDGSTPTRSRPCWAPPATVSGAAARGRRG